MNTQEIAAINFRAWCKCVEVQEYIKAQIYRKHLGALGYEAFIAPDGYILLKEENHVSATLSQRYQMAAYQLRWHESGVSYGVQMRMHYLALLLDTIAHQLQHHKHSYRLIKETPLPDFTDQERLEIACIARYHRRALPSTSHKEFAALGKAERKRVSMLAALLRIADALDFSHDSRVLHLTAQEELCDEKTWTILMQLRPLADLDLEMQHAYEKADLFEKVFKHQLRLVIQEN